MKNPPKSIGIARNRFLHVAVLPLVAHAYAQVRVRAGYEALFERRGLYPLVNFHSLFPLLSRREGATWLGCVTFLWIGSGRKIEGFTYLRDVEVSAVEIYVAGDEVLVALGALRHAPAVGGTGELRRAGWVAAGDEAVATGRRQVSGVEHGGEKQATEGDHGEGSQRQIVDRVGKGARGCAAVYVLENLGCMLVRRAVG